MGDHRASIQITFEMHGIKKECDMWINWWDNGNGIDDRIIEFFSDASSEAMLKWNKIIYDSQKIEREKQVEENDFCEFQRLKKKYAVKEKK